MEFAAILSRFGDAGGAVAESADHGQGGERVQEDASTVSRRYRFTETDDMLLLTQANADQPFEAGHGKVLRAWDAVAAKLVQHRDFKLKHVDGKSCQARFKKKVELHRKFQRASLAKSGTSEEQTELIQLLDDIVAVLDDYNVHHQ